MKDSVGNELKAERGALSHLIQWAGRHPGYLVLGALMVAFLSLQPSHKPTAVVQEAPADDVPLFV